MNKGTKLRTILAIATSLNTALMATDLTGFSNPTVDLIYKIASIVLNFIIVAIATYYNNDYTDTAARFTGAMRMTKSGMPAGGENPGTSEEEHERFDPED